MAGRKPFKHLTADFTSEQREMVDALKRNYCAGSLRHYKPQRISDKREKLRAKFDQRAYGHGRRYGDIPD